MARSKILGIELLKFFAAVMITNSHFKGLYIEPFTPLGTLGAPGNALFFFISGYTLMLGRKGSFPMWYKRRISRIWPSVLVWTSLVGPLCFGLSLTWKDVWLAGNYWFIHCIIIYYLIFYFLIDYIERYFSIIFGSSIALSLVYFFVMPVTHLSIYQVSYHYICFLSIMFMGAYCALRYNRENKCNNKFSLGIALFLLCLFYTFQAIGKGRTGLPYYISIISLLPLHGFIYYFYKTSMCDWVEKILQMNYVGKLIRFIAALTLEIYLVGFVLCITSLNDIFPFNIIIVFGIIVMVAYVVKVISNFVIQTFDKDPYHWKQMVVII